MREESLQLRYAPASRCFGCGPANGQGLRIGGDRVVVDAEVASGGIITATCRGTFVAVGPDHPRL